MALLVLGITSLMVHSPFDALQRGCPRKIGVRGSLFRTTWLASDRRGSAKHPRDVPRRASLYIRWTAYRGY